MTGTRLEPMGLLVDMLAGEVTITYNVRHHHGEEVHLLASMAQAKISRMQLGDPLWSQVEKLVSEVTKGMSTSVGLTPAEDGGETPLDSWDPKTPKQEQDL